MKAEQQYIDLYSQASRLISQRSCAVMNLQREAAFHAFQQQGFPSQKVERYKYTDVATAFAPNFGLSLTPLQVSPSRYIFSFHDAPIDLTPYYNKIADTADSLTALNTALAHDGLLIYVPKGEHPADPIQVDNLLSGTAPTMMNRRVLILLEAGAQATVIMNDRAGQLASPFLTLQVVEVICKEGSRIDLYEVEETLPLCTRFSNVYVQAQRDSIVGHNSITLNGGHTRNLCDVHLQGPYAEVTLGGCAIGTGQQHIDNNTLIRHTAPHGQSRQLYKYVLDGHSVGAFAGKILVEKDAQKTTSQETNANLCASPQARMYTQPMLEIYADDVKCNHGSTVGVLDPAALFYMLQRGIPEAEARSLLKNAFMGQVIDQIQYRPLRDRLYVKVEKRFRGEHEKCDDCRLCK
ncbi:MAG: Fe-S cluster assembly protein SufD [Bacteroidaceae bacterium]|nr:Fe-S cluster assembly protein SufD [Bacteroidaceae bacterium]